MLFTIAIVIVSVLAVAAILGAMIVKNLTEICQPNEVLIFSGSSRRMGKKRVGYRLVHGGRAMRVPLMETVNRLDLTNMVIDLRVVGAYSKGGIPLNVQGVANVKIASEEPTISNAIERFLGVPRATIIRVAKETLEGNLRGVLATLTPEEVNQDRIKFGQSLLHEAEIDLKRIGLCLDMLKIQHVSDDVGYLDSIGRKQSAGLVMTSRVAEAENTSLAAVREAENKQTREIARINAQISMAVASADRRIVDAKTRRQAVVTEEESRITAKVAKARAELEVQKARIKQVELQLMADRIHPAQARRDEMVSEARGQAAQLVEQGRANAESIRSIARTWNEAGESARQVFVAQKLNGLVDNMMDTVSEMTVENVTMIDTELARANGDSGGDLAVKATLASEKLKHTLGVDVPELLKGLTNGKGVRPPQLPR